MTSTYELVASDNQHVRCPRIEPSSPNEGARQGEIYARSYVALPRTDAS